MVLAQNKNELKNLDSLAFVTLQQNKPDLEKISNKFLKVALRSKPSKYLINALILKGIINKNRGFYLSSLDYYIKALESSKKIKDQKRESTCYNNIATVYSLQSNYPKAIEYFEKSLELEKKFKNQLQISIRYFNLGDCYNAIDSLDLALSYYNSSLILEKKLNNKEGVFFAEHGIAEVYLKNGRLDDAYYLLNKSEILFDAMGIENQLIYLKLSSELFSRRNMVHEAIFSIKKGLNLADKYDFKIRKLELLKTQISILKKANIPEELNKAYENYLEFTSLLEKYNAKNRLDDLSYRDKLTRNQFLINETLAKRKIAEQNEIKERLLKSYSQKMMFFTLFLIIFILGLVIYGVQKLTKNRDL